MLIGLVAVVELLRTFVRWNRANNYSRAGQGHGSTLDARYQRFIRDHEAYTGVRVPEPVWSKERADSAAEIVNAQDVDAPVV
jgi:hypothetical protein